MEGVTRFCRNCRRIMQIIGINKNNIVYYCGWCDRCAYEGKVEVCEVSTQSSLSSPLSSPTSRSSGFKTS